jgi:hypothetical protein
MILFVYLALLGIACVVAAGNWRRGWMLLPVFAILQDPVRKLTPGTPVALSFSIMAVYAALLFSARFELQRALNDFTRRFGDVTRAVTIVVMVLVVAGLNGLVTFGAGNWKVPLLSFVIYTAPIPAVLFAFAYIRREEQIFTFFRYYAILTSIMLIGSLLEYLRVQFPALGLVAGTGDYIRHLPGLQIRMISGFYRAPDIMGWHAATLASIGIAMSVRGGFGLRAWPWMLTTAWAFFHCMISGRRKAVYYVAAFALVLVWRYFRRLHFGQVVALLLTGLVMGGVVRQISSREASSVYTRGAATTRGELTQRLEGGIISTIEQVGLMGVGLGSATQGVRHLLGTELDVGWQEGGLGKLAAEVGVPGVLAFAFLGMTLVLLALKLTRIGDVPGTSQLARVTLFALVAANAANFMASAQAYSDAMLALTTAFFIGALFATATLDERLVEEQQRAAAAAAVPASAAA